MTYFPVHFALNNGHLNIQLGGGVTILLMKIETVCVFCLPCIFCV